MQNDISYILCNDAEINEISKQLLEAYKANLTTFDAIASGKLRDTARYEIEADEEHFVLYFELEGYWNYLEFGPSPHFPPIAAIENWINTKGIVPRARRGRVPTTKQLAFAICKSMAKGKRDIDGKQVAYLARPAIRYMLNDQSALVQRLASRIGDIYAEISNRQIESILSDINQQSAYI